MKNMLLKILLILCTLFLIYQPVSAINFVDRDFTNLNVVRWKVDEYQREFKDKKGSKEAETAFVNFLEYYNNFVEFQNERYRLQDDPLSEDGSYDSQNKRLDDFYSYYGLKVKLNDLNMFYFSTNNKYIYDNFAPYLNKDWQELLKYNQHYDRVMSFDFKYTVSKDELKQMVMFYENFYKKYPNFSQKDMIKTRIKDIKEDIRRYPHT